MLNVLPSFFALRLMAAALVLALVGCDARMNHDQQAWALRLDSRSQYSVGSGQGLFFVANDKGTLSAIAPARGSNVWTVSGLGQPLSGPIAAGPAVCMATMDGYVHGLSAWTGARLWTISPFGPLHMRAEGRFVAFLNALDGHIYGLDAMNGNLKWDFDPGRGQVIGPVINSNTVYLAKNSVADEDVRRLIALSVETGLPELDIPLEDDVSDLAVFAGVVYLAHRTGLVWAIASDVPRLLWRRQTGHLPATPLSVNSNGVYYGTRDGWLCALDPATGEERWRLNVGQEPVAALALDGNQAYASELKRCWLALDLSARAVLWKIPADAAGSVPPALAERWVAWPSTDGWIRCFFKTPEN